MMIKAIRAVGILIIVFIASCLLWLSTDPNKFRNENESLKNVIFQIDWDPAPDYIGYYIADEKGFYDEKGLDVEIRVLPGLGGAPENARYIGKCKDGIWIGTTTGDQVVTEQHERFPIVSVATIFPRNPVVIFSLSVNPVPYLKDLKDKKLGVNTDSVTYKQFDVLSNRISLDRESIVEVPVGRGGTDKLIRGEIDALLAYTMVKPVKVEQLGREVYRIPLRDYGLKLIGQVIAVNKEKLRDHRPLVSDFVHASVKGWEYARNHPDEAVALFCKRFKKEDPEFCKASLVYTLPLLPRTLDGYMRQDLRLWQETQGVLREMGAIRKEEPDIDAGNFSADLSH